jgi:hypothetical protein
VEGITVQNPPLELLGVLSSDTAIGVGIGKRLTHVPIGNGVFPGNCRGDGLVRQVIAERREEASLNDAHYLVV